ncbi:MAG: hypothetical protein QM723_01530 [Myxococcaceae bacterium]
MSATVTRGRPMLPAAPEKSTSSNGWCCSSALRRRISSAEATGGGASFAGGVAAPSAKVSPRVSAPGGQVAECSATSCSTQVPA